MVDLKLQSGSRRRSVRPVQFSQRLAHLRRLHSQDTPLQARVPKQSKCYMVRKLASLAHKFGKEIILNLTFSMSLTKASSSIAKPTSSAFPWK